MNGACNDNLFLAPPPGALGRGQKVKYHLISITESISKFLYQTLCVFSQMKDTRLIDRIFILSPGPCLRGGTLGCWGCPWGSKVYFFQTWSCGISN